MSLLDKFLIDRAIVEGFKSLKDRRPVEVATLATGNGYKLLLEVLGLPVGQFGVQTVGEGECLQGPLITEIQIVAIRCSLHDEAATLYAMDIDAAVL
jgi:hypothetical protein